MEKLLTGIGPVKYNGFMRFPGSVLHFVLHISEDGILYIEASGLSSGAFILSQNRLCTRFPARHCPGYASRHPPADHLV